MRRVTRCRLWQIAQQTHWDKMFFQRQHDYLDDESYEDSFKTARAAPGADLGGTWSAGSSPQLPRRDQTLEALVRGERDALDLCLIQASQEFAGTGRRFCASTISRLASLPKRTVSL